MIHTDCTISRAERVIDFIETLKCPDGPKAGTPFILRDWQKSIVRAVYGDLDETGLRRVRQAVMSIPRKNGKSVIVAGLALAHLCGPEAIRNGQLYSLSVDREQAGVLFNYMRDIIYMDDEFNERLNVVESQKYITDPVSGSRYKVLSGEKKGKMGKSSSVIFFDELAEFGADRDLYDALMTSRGAHDEPLVWVFSTQAPSDTALLSELIDYGEKVNAGEIEDPSFKLFLYAAPEDADPWNEQTWLDCNPALGDFKNLEILREEALKAQRMPSAEAAFRNLHLNQRIDASEQFITRSVWKENGALPGEMGPSPLHGGLDLSGKNDLSSLVFVCTDLESGGWDVFCRFWAPKEGVRDREERDRAPYTVWARNGELILTPGKTIDYGFIARELAVLHAQYDIAGIKFDRWRIADLQRECGKIGLDTWIDGEDAPMPGGLRLIKHGQGYQDMNPAVESLEDALTDVELRHGNHPILTWCAANVRVQSDPAGNRKFDKIKSTGRIDGIVALAMAKNGAVRYEPVENTIPLAVWA